MKNTKDSGNMVSVLQDFKNYVDLKKFAESQHLTITTLQHKLSLLEEENKKLKQLVVDTNKDLFIGENKAIKIEITPEESIIVEQIDHLRSMSSNRALTLEEVKRLDLLIKNLNLIKHQATTIISEPKKLNVSDAKLVEIAARKLDDEQ